jgi:hypothetical protein
VSAQRQRGSHAAACALVHSRWRGNDTTGRAAQLTEIRSAAPRGNARRAPDEREAFWPMHAQPKNGG